MQEIFYEESSKTQNQKSEKTKYMVFKIMSILSWIFVAVWLYIFILVFPLSGDNLFLRILFALLPACLFATTAIVFSKFKNKFYLDYDYTFVSGEVRISKIIKEIKRKPVMRFTTYEIEKLGKYGSDTFNTYFNMHGIKKLILTSNSTPTEGKDFYYLVINQEEKKILVLECTETFIVNILKFSNKTIVEKDYK